MANLEHNNYGTLDQQTMLRSSLNQFPSTCTMVIPNHNINVAYLNGFVMLKWLNLTLHPQGLYGALILILAHLTLIMTYIIHQAVLKNTYTNDDVVVCVCFRNVGLEAPRPFRLGFWEPKAAPQDELGRPLLSHVEEQDAGPSTDPGGSRASSLCPPLIRPVRAMHDW